VDGWTRRIIRHRKKVLAGWLVVLVIGGYGAANVGKLLSNRFSVPGSDAERGLDLLKDRFDERGDGAFTLVFQADRPVAKSPAFRRRVEAAAQQAAGAVGGARPGPLLPASRTVAYVQIQTPLENADAADRTQTIRDATPRIPGATTYLSGFPAINHDTQKMVRALLVPALMKLLGDWNWYLPERVRRAMRLGRPKPAAQTGGSSE
jgi:putative drug exporter of the RND superfamily